MVLSTDSAFIQALIQAALSIIIQQWMRLKIVGNTVWFQITYIFPWEILMRLWLQAQIPITNVSLHLYVNNDFSKPWY